MTKRTEKNDRQKWDDVAWREQDQQDQSQNMNQGGNIPADGTVDEFERLRIHYTAEALMKSLAHSFEEEFAAEYDRFMEESPELCLPEELDRKLRAEIRNYEQGRKQEQRGEEQALSKEKTARRKKYTGILLKACVFLLAVTVTFTVFTAPQASALREKIYKILVEQNDGNMSVNFREESEREESEEEAQSPGEQGVSSEISDADKTAFPEGVDYLLFPSELPEGYELEEIQKLGNSIWIDFYNEVRDDWITMDYSDAESRVMYIDTDHSRNTEITIDGQPGMIQETEDIIDVFWVSDDKVISVMCSCSYFNVEHVLDIVDSVQWYNKENFEKIKKNS